MNTLPPQQTLAVRRLDSLDLLRFFAAASVLLYHYTFIGPLQGFWPKTLLIPIAHWGDLGVDLFFVISGFVITLTSENRGPGAFLSARATRLFPTFAVCSAITAGMAITLPGISATEILPRWLASLSYFPRAFGFEPLSSVYWTLAIEVQFYGLVALLLAMGWWKRHGSLIIWAWLLISFATQYLHREPLLAEMLITEYAGHFCTGMILYRIHTGQPPRFAMAALLLAFSLISKHIQHIDEWLGGSYQTLFPSIGILLAAPALAGLVLCAARAPALPRGLIAKGAAVLGAMSYPLYLVHADLGFWSHAIFERKWFGLYPSLAGKVTYPSMAFGALALSLLIAGIVATRVEPGLQGRMKSVLTRLSLR